MSAPDKPPPDPSRPDEPRPDVHETAAGDGPDAPHPIEKDAVRRQRRARVFGETLPDGTRDERGDEWGEREEGGGSEEWLRRQVPPHHG